MMDGSIKKHMDLLLGRYPALAAAAEEIWKGFELLRKAYADGNKLLTAGNGGSAADAGHITGELMKGFKRRRKIDDAFAAKLTAVDGTRGAVLAKELQGALTAIPLTGCEALSTAYMNDVGGSVFAQQLYGYGKAGDVLLAISTSGNSQNIVDAAIAAKAMELRVLALTGAGGGKLSALADVLVAVPEKETYRVQELHLPVYHCWCMMLEDYFYEE